MIQKIYLLFLVTSMVNWRKMDLIPINVRNIHWALVYVDTEKMKINYLDSLKSMADKNCGSTILGWVTYLDGIDPNKWEIIYCDVPQQNNAYDCGVYVCKFAEHILRGFKVNFGSLDYINSKKTSTPPKLYNKNIFPQDH